jgi:hemolysin activation/secretion protein
METTVPALPCRRAIALGTLMLSSSLHAQLSLDQQEQRERAQREARARQAQQEAPDVRFEKPASHRQWRDTVLPAETDCHALAAIHLEGEHVARFAFAQRYLDRYQGRCVGTEGLNLIVRRVADLIVERGYVTSRIGLPPDAFDGSTLRLALVAGTIHEVRMATPSAVAGDWRFALPSRPGDLLNLRDIEQAVEQFKRLSSQDVSIDIAPTDVAGTSDLVISVARTRPWHLFASLDDSGAPATGRRQGALNGTFDNVLGINDVLNLGASSSVPQLATAGTRGWNGFYSVPWGKWLTSVSLSDYRYQQQVNGFQQSFLSSGKSRTTDITVQRLVRRNSRGKTAVELRVGKRWAHSFIEDVEIQSQRRNVTHAEIALVQRQYLGRAQLDLRLAHRRGLSWLGGQGDVPGRRRDEPSFRYALTTLDASLNIPFAVGKLPVQWTSEYRIQRSSKPLYASEFITLGGRYTVRGFNGEQTLAGDRGWYWRNTLSAPLGAWPVAAYLGLDTGHVGGPGALGLAAKSLRGTVVGIRGGVGKVGFDAFLGRPVAGAGALNARAVTSGFQLSYAF